MADPDEYSVIINRGERGEIVYSRTMLFNRKGAECAKLRVDN
jgi:hypothetical protein